MWRDDTPVTIVKDQYGLYDSPTAVYIGNSPGDVWGGPIKFGFQFHPGLAPGQWEDWDDIIVAGTMEEVLAFLSGSVIPDAIPPSIPTNLAAAAIAASQVDLSWDAATDNVGVAGYALYRDGGLIVSPSSTTYTDASLAAGTTYSYQVAAADGAGNTSTLSASVPATTQADSGSGPSSGSSSSGGGGCGSIRLDPPQPPSPGQVALELAALLFPLLLLARRRFGRARPPVSA